MVQIVNVLRGPIHSSDDPDWDMEDDGFGLRYNEGYILDVVVRDDRGVLSEDQLIYEDFEDAMSLVDHFMDQIIPVEWEENL